MDFGIDFAGSDATDAIAALAGVGIVSFVILFRVATRLLTQVAGSIMRLTGRR